LRICFISNPNSIHTQRWVKWFSNRGHQVVLIGDTKLGQPWHSIPLFDLPARINIPKLKYLAWIFWTRKIIKRWQPDILHAHRVTGAGWIGSFTGFHPFVVTPWGTDLYQYPYRSRLGRWLTHHVLNHADLITAGSTNLLQQACLFGAQPEKACLIHWGVNLNFFHPIGQTDQLRKKLGLGDEPVVLSFRAIHPIYKQDTILEAISEALKMIPNIELVLINFNPEPAYQKKLGAKIIELGLEDHVIWIKEAIPWEKMPEVYRLADVGISVPSSDSVPVSLLEAISCGLPVIASNLPSIREWIIHGENGLLVPAGDPRALSEAILQLLHHPEQGEKFRQFNQNLIHERANHEHEMIKMETLYEKLAMEKYGKDHEPCSNAPI